MKISEKQIMELMNIAHAHIYTIGIDKSQKISILLKQIYSQQSEQLKETE